MFKKMMYTTALALVCVNSSHAIEMWNSNTVWGGQGRCEATFTFDSGGAFADYALNNVRIDVDLYKGGKKIGSDRLEVQEMGRSNAERYTEASIDSEALCEDDLSIVVTKATASINNKRVDLLKTKQLAYRPFKPFSIKIPK
jgi:hypothetical protein